MPPTNSLSSAQVEMKIPAGRSGLWKALAATVQPGTDDLPTISVSDIRRTGSMFDYDPTQARPTT